MNNNGTTFPLQTVVLSSTAATLLPTSRHFKYDRSSSSAIDPTGPGDTTVNRILNCSLSGELIPLPKQRLLPLTLYGNPWPVDTRWSPASGNSFMLLSDDGRLVVYRIDARGQDLPPKQAYSAGQGTLLGDQYDHRCDGTDLRRYAGAARADRIWFITPLIFCCTSAEEHVTNRAVRCLRSHGSGPPSPRRRTRPAVFTYQVPVFLPVFPGPPAWVSRDRRAWRPSPRTVFRGQRCAVTVPKQQPRRGGDEAGAWLRRPRRPSTACRNRAALNSSCRRARQNQRDQDSARCNVISRSSAIDFQVVD